MAYLPSMHSAALTEVFQRWPNLIEAFQAYMHQVMRGPSPLSEGQRELLGAFVSRRNGCRFCELAHAKVAERFGMDSGVLDDLNRDINGAPVEERWKPLFRLAEKLTAGPAAIDQKDVDPVLEAGWDETALYHAIHVCAAFNCINRIVDGLGIEVDPKMAEMAAQTLHDQGYEAATGVVDVR